MLPQSGRWVHESGECEIDLTRRELRTRGVPVAIGARAFGIVEALVQSAGELVTKDELMQRVWPNAIVEEHTLHVHISAVRKALGRYRAILKTESGRGYRLTGRWAAGQQSERTAPDARATARAPPAQVRSNLPVAASDLIGRDHVVRHVQDLVSAYRVVTLTGPGGIGKTRLALEVARVLLPTFGGDAWLVELASLSDADLVAAAVAGTLGVQVRGNSISPEALARAIGGRRILIVVDNCEHLINAAAKVLETVIGLCPAASVLATSRERMRIEGECAYRVPPLDVSVPDASAIGGDGILQASAIQLFIARMAAWQSDFQYHDDLSEIGEICRHLDGIPLGIELAAARAATLGVKQVLSGLHDRFNLLVSGRRTALPKHRTLRATLDWSYQLLSGPEQLLLQHLAIFAAAFTLEAAGAVTGSGEAPAVEIVDGIASLAEKSLVTTDTTVVGTQFRLLETTRVYAFEKLAKHSDQKQLTRRHAEYYRRRLDTIAQLPGTVDLNDLANVRAALEWCFGDNGDEKIGVGLAAAASPIFLAMSLLPECHRWSERAILALEDATRGGAEEMHLQASLGVSSMQMHGQSDEARVALRRGLAIAEALSDVPNQVSMLAMLSGFHFRNGDFTTTLHYAQLMRAIVGNAEGSTATAALADAILGSALHFRGDLGGSRVALASAFQYWSCPHRTSEVHLGYNFYIFVGIGLALTRWLQGHPAQAIECARKIIKEAERENHPASLGLCLSWAPWLFLWIGDLASAEEHIDRLISYAESHSLGPYIAIAQGYQGILAIARGDAMLGVESLRRCLNQLHGTFKTSFKLSLVQGFTAIGQVDEGLKLVDETIGLIEANGDLLHMAEALRVKGRVLLSMPQPRHQEAETCFVQSLDWSRRQMARSWELRAAVDLAALWAAQGQPKRGRAVLEPIFEQFMEGFDTADLQAAKQILTTLR